MLEEHLEEAPVVSLRVILVGRRLREGGVTGWSGKRDEEEQGEFVGEYSVLREVLRVVSPVTS
jgi:hypothetical protein